jgi:hypothetical protein
VTREEFTKQIKMLAEIVDDDACIAQWFEVAPSTVRRWVEGVSCPAPKMREYIVEELKEMLEQR